MTDYELCKELYELTGWEHTKPSSSLNRWYSANGSLVKFRSEKGNAVVPDYSTDYLLTKLPDYKIYPILELGVYGRWWAKYGYKTKTLEVVKPGALYAVEDTPKTALLKLAIELAKAGVIGKEAN